MKVLINDCCGGFEFNEKFLNWYLQNYFEAKKPYDYLDIKYGSFKRNDKEIIAAVEEFEKLFNETYSEEYADINIVKIPEEATDWIIEESNGEETILYVLNGKIYYA